MGSKMAAARRVVQLWVHLGTGCGCGCGSAQGFGGLQLGDRIHGVELRQPELVSLSGKEKERVALPASPGRWMRSTRVPLTQPRLGSCPASHRGFPGGFNVKTADASVASRSLLLLVKTLSFLSPINRGPYFSTRFIRFAGLQLPDFQAEVVKPHTPLIKFPDRKSTLKLKMQESLQARVPPLHGVASQFSAESKTPSYQSTLFTGRTQGIPDTAELVRTLPQKYRRKPMSIEEMEFIQRGGPE